MARAGLTPERLVLAGAELADATGFDALTMTALARHFGVKAASLYSHLDSSGDLRNRVAVLSLDELAGRAGAALAGRAGRDALVALADTYRDYANKHPGRYAASRHRLPTELVEAGAGRAHAELMLAILRGYDLEGPEAVHGVRLIGSVLHGFIDLELSGAFDHRAPTSQESWVRVVDALDGMLRSW